VRRALRGARELRRVIRANFAVAIAYNIVALTLCYLGLVSPVVAAILMPVSSVALVSLTTWRLTGRRLEWMS
jgi:cation transport ATPase